MSEIIKQSMADIWASIGDVVAPDVEKIAEGWSVEVVPRQYWNWMQNRTDTNLAYLFQHGIPEWDATVEYIVNKSYVTYADVVYKAILTGTNKIPSSQPSYWKVAFATSTAALEALKATTPAADKLPYYTSATTAATTTITSLARTLLDATTQAAMLTTIGAQPVDATLTALAGVTTATNKLPYFSGVDTATVTDLTTFGRSLLDDADATAARLTLVLNNVDNTSDANKPVSTAQQTALNLKANLASPTFTGVPLAPTASLNTATTQVATTAYVTGQAATVVSPMDGAAAVGTSLRYARQDHVHASDTSLLPLTGGNMTGDLVYQNVAVGGWARGLAAKIQSSGTFAGGIGFYGNGDSVTTAFIGVGPSFWSSGNGVRVTAAGVTISGATTFDTLITGSVNGNAATATKLQTARSIALAGDVTGSATFDGSDNLTIAATVADNSHNHTIANVDGLQTALNAASGLAQGATTQDPNLATAPVIITNHANTPGGGVYWHITTTFYAGISTAANRAQIAVQYNWGNQCFARSSYDGVWTAWARLDNSSVNASALTGVIADACLSGTYTGVSITGNAATATTLTGLTPTVAELNYVDGVTSSIQTQLNAKASLDSPALSGTPTAPTATVGTNTTQLATTAFVLANGGGLGAGQTWQNVTGSRAKSTTYTNSTGRPIQLYITGDLNAATLTIGGVALASQDYNGASFINTIIPNNTTYSLTWGGSAPTLWAELR